VTLYRVFWRFPSAAENLPGGALYIPRQGSGRFDNPAQYQLLYLGREPHGAVAEAFGRFPAWSASVLERPPSLPPNAVRALAVFELDHRARVCDLDDPAQLVALRTTPSQVITRDCPQTQRRALGMFHSGSWVGVKWWSLYEASWTNVALWDHALVRIVDERPLTLTDSALRAAATAIGRVVS
jgi:RES domain-containing protein